MGRTREPCPPTPDALAQALTIDDAGRLIWRTRPRDNNRHAGKPAGGGRRGRLIVSLRDSDGVLRTIAADRAAFALAFGRYPRGRVAFADGDSQNLKPGNLIEAPRRARSPGRRGGKRGEHARDMAALLALDDRPLTVSALAETTKAEPSNARRRLCKLMAKGLVAAPPTCSRGWALTAAGRKAARDADLAGPSPPLRNGAAVPWLKPIGVCVGVYRRAITDEGASPRFG